jgi:inosose dehydratase
VTRQPNETTRRAMLKSAAAIAASLAAAPAVLAADAPSGATGELIGPSTPGAGNQSDRLKGLKLGVASYSFRKIPLDATIKAIRRVGLAYVSIKDFHLPLKSTTDERKAVAQQFRDAGITPISCGVITLKNDEAACRNAFEYTRDIGAPTMVCSPAPEALPLLDKLVKEFDIRLAIHNHGPEDKVFPSPLQVLEAVDKLDRRIGLCIDVGHTARAKVDPAEAIRKGRERLYDVHFKDIANPGGKNASVEVEVGRGVLDVRGMLAALLEVKFGGHVGFEHEKDPVDPLPGLAESVGYTKGVLSTLG